MNHPLGRLVEHDPRSRSFKAPKGAIQSVQHFHFGLPLDQGNIGSCTGYAMAQLLNTKPLASEITRRYLDPEAIDLYSLATSLDEFDGTYPPEDTGSSGLAVSKAAFKRGYINAYSHAFGLTETLAALTLQPVLVGTNWYEGMFTPDENGLVTISGEVVGGHEYLLTGVDVVNHTVTGLNSWGTGWGLNGVFTMSWDTLDRLLKEQGDCTVPLINAIIHIEPVEPVIVEPVPAPPAPVEPSAGYDLFREIWNLIVRFFTGRKA